MRDNLTSTELNTMRRRPQRTKWYLAHHRPFAWANLSLVGTPNNYPVSAIEFTGGSTGIQAGMTAWIGNNNGSNLGIVRVRKAPANGTNILPIAEAGSGLINWKEATTISVRDQFLPWPKHPRYDTNASVWRMDYDDTYSHDDYNNLVQVNIGTPIVAFLDNGSFNASFVDDRSLSWDASITTRAWYWPNGSVSFDPGTISSPNVVTFTGASPNGSYFRNEMFTTNGASSVGRRLIYLFDDESQLPQVSFGEVQGGYVNGGYRATITAYGGTAQTIQENSEIIIFEQSSYNGIASSIGGNDPINKNIVFRGWVVQGTLQKNPFTNSATFEAQTIDGILSKQHSYDVFLSQASPVPSASHWIASERLTMDRAALTMLKFRNTAGELVDFNPASGLGITNTILFQSLPRGSFWEQLRSNYNDKGILGVVSADMQSNLFAFADAEVSGASAALPSLSIINSDIMGAVQIDYQPFEQNAHTQLYAVAGDVPLGAESPGTLAGYYGGQMEISRGLTVDTQDTLITWAGNQRAKLNKKFPRVTIPFSGNYKLDPVPQQTAKFSMKSSENALGVSWSGKNFYPTSLRMMYDAGKGYANSEWELTEAVNGIGGSSITFPSVDDIVPIPTQPPDANPDPITPGEGTGFGTVYVALLNTLGRTRNFGAASPAWADITPPGITASGIYDWILDPWNPAENGYLLTIDGVYKSTDLTSETPSFDLVLSAGQVIASSPMSTFTMPYKIIGSINVQGYYAFLAKDTATNLLYCIYTYDGFDTFSVSSTGITAGNYWGALDYVPHLINGNVMLYLFNPSGTVDSFKIYRSANGGQTWGLYVSHDRDGTGWSFSDGYEGGIVHCPYNNNLSGNNVYYGIVDTTGSQQYIGFCKTDGVTQTVFQTRTSIGGQGTFSKRTGIETYTQSQNSIYYWVTSTIYVSSDGGSSFDSYDHTSLEQIFATGGFPYNQSQYYMVTRGNGSMPGIYVSTDGGQTFINKTGDWAFSDSMSGQLTRGRGTIVPLWTE